MLVRELVRLLDTLRAPVERRPVRSGRVGHREGERVNAVAVGGDVGGNRARGNERRREHEAHVSVLHDP